MVQVKFGEDLKRGGKFWAQRKGARRTVQRCPEKWQKKLIFEEKEQGWLAGERIHEGNEHLMVVNYVPGT